MRNATATTFLYAEAIFYIVILPLLNLYFLFCGIMFNVIVFLLLVWG